MVRHTIKLDGPASHGARVSFHVLRPLSDALLDSAQRSLRLRVEGRSHLHGKGSWLDAATNIELVGLRENCTVLEIEAPTLGEAAPRIFEQLPMWDFAPRREQTAISIVEETLCDAVRGNGESDLLDRNILDATAEFSRVMNLGFERIAFDGSGVGVPVDVTPHGLETAERLREEAPPAERVIVSGWLDQLTGSTRAFTLLLPTGQRLKGFLPQGDTSVYGPLWQKKVVVDGEARFRPSGMVSLIIASNIQAATEADEVWGHVPTPRPRSVAELKPRIPHPPGTNGMERVFGQWPGNESTEELLAALKAMG